MGPGHQRAVGQSVVGRTQSGRSATGPPIIRHVLHFRLAADALRTHSNVSAYPISLPLLLTDDPTTSDLPFPLCPLSRPILLRCSRTAQHLLSR